MTAGQEQTIQRQALPMPGEPSELEVLSEKLYAEYLSKMPSAGGGKSHLGRAGTLWLHLKKAEKGWTQANQSGTGLGVGNPNRYPKEGPSQSKQEKSNQPSRSPLTNELLDPGEELLGELDYEDVEETNLGPKQIRAVPAWVLGTRIGTPRKDPLSQSRKNQTSPAVPLSPTSY